MSLLKIIISSLVLISCSSRPTNRNSETQPTKAATSAKGKKGAPVLPSATTTTTTLPAVTTSTTVPPAWIQEATEVYDKIDSSSKTDPYSIGAVLPLTGKYQNVAQKYLRGLQMGLGLSDGKETSFKLAIVDSQGQPELARIGTERLAQEDGVIAIVGDIISKSSVSVANQSQQLGVPLIGLSPRAGLTETSESTFRHALTTEAQVEFLVQYAHDELGVKNFAVLYPNDSYGVEATNIFWDEVLARGGKIAAAQTYDPNDKNFAAAVQKLGMNFYQEPRIEELKYRAKEKEEKNKEKKKARVSRREEEIDILAPIVDFEAIFIPDGTKNLAQLIAMLSYYGVKDVWLLGTNLWNSPELARRSQSFASDLIFTDGMAPELNNHPFFKEYAKIYGDKVTPSLFEVIGFDTGLMLRQQILSGNRDRKSLAAALADLKAFPGALGPVFQSSDREFFRPLRALTLKDGSIQPFDNTTNKKK